MWSAVMGNNFMELPLDLPRVRNCQAFNCIVVKYHTIVCTYEKVLFGTLNAILMVYFLYMLRKKHTLQQNDSIVKITTILEVALNAIPTIFAALFIKITNQGLSNYAGEIVVLLFGLSIAICSMFYSKILLRNPTRLFVMRPIASVEANNLTCDQTREAIN
ncbi:hypothetical protein DdX_19594 [Ditylenchus destructor]|uniref:Uncharacterized protein n=1 Tax=Ditylenchus destructor TaxID=166010 RepID=A0AAD4MI49_9BILA|nr:hypothetical protein DdX_19594 [Ditylenchus destructor]